MKIRVLLTAAVRPQSTFRLNLTDADARRAQYLTAAQKWARWAEQTGNSITFMENSGHDLDGFARDAGLTRSSAVEWVNVPTPPDAAVTRGKGASEALMFDAFSARYADADDDLWVKVTGRLFVTNMNAALPSTVPGGFLARLSISLDHVDTRVIGATPAAWTRYFTGMTDAIDEANEVRIEHVAARRVLRGLGDGLHLTRFLQQPAIEGVSGTWAGRSYGTPTAALKRAAAHQIERALRTSLQNKHF